MENFNFKSNTRLVFGKDTHEEVGKYVKPYAKKVLVHFEGDGSLIKKLGIYDKAIKSLEANGIEYLTLGGVVPNPRISTVYEGIKIAKENDIDFILAIGGGSVIDSSKAIALGIKYDGDVWDFFTGKNEPIESANVGVILTIPGSGSEMSESSIISHEELELKCVCDTEHNFPVFSVLDPQVCFSIPTRLMACGVTDIMSHLMERYFSQASHTELSDALMEAAMRTVLEFGPKIIENPKEYNNAAQIMWAATVAHNGMIAAGRIADWSSHRIEHEISAIYDITHGAGMAIIFPSWMKYVKDANLDVFVNFATKVFSVESTGNKEEVAMEGIRRLEDFFRSLGLKTTLTEANIDDENFEIMAEKALAGSETLGRFKKLTKEDIVKILNLSK